MLVIARKNRQSIYIVSRDGLMKIKLSVWKSSGSISVGIDAPEDVKVHREETMGNYLDEVSEEDKSPSK